MRCFDQGWATIIAAIFATLITVFGISIQLQENRKAQESQFNENREAELLKDKKEAYLLAFEAINHVLGNTSFDGCPPSNPHSYDLTKVRVAMDRLLMFSGEPIESVKAYQRALGVDEQKPIQALGEFRAIALRDIGKPNVAFDEYLTKTNGWIAATPHPATKATIDCRLAQRNISSQTSGNHKPLLKP